MSGSATALVGLVMVVGLAGTIVPLVPGLLLIWAAALGYGVLGGWGTAGLVAFAVITVLLIFGTVAQYVMAHRSAAAGGAAGSSMLLAAVLGFVGFFVIPVAGFFVGAVLGVLIGEQRRLGRWDRAWRVTLQVVKGFGIGLLVEVACGLLMILAWAGWVVANR